MSTPESPAGFDEISRMKQNGEVYCRDCAAIISAKAEICPHCGVRQMGVFQVVSSQPVPQKSRIVAALLALFLGAFGIHKFYLGQTLVGILYAIFFWTFIPGLIAFFEGIGFLLMSDEAFAQKYDRLQQLS